ncbi:acetoacetate decarboxylase family protein [Maricaulis maris]|jgi:acetoacetate decarboxylase|uniref:acetoacetate decarboxylase family protein n=1 Tax=Maricaulis maris TaxID=74318 RepID=UPI002922E2B4|nr:hypothetical protein MACH15_02380 [Maricaulis maris]
MFSIDVGKSYMMPAHFGPRYVGPGTSGWYHDVTAITLSFVTDPEALAAYLPPRFRVAEEAVVSVIYACNKRVDWLAGRGYNMLGANAAVVYDGPEEQVEGSYSLVLWENLTDPILTGRELQGIPKLFADIPEHTVNSESWRVGASLYGNKIVDLEVSGVRAPSLEEVAAINAARSGKDNPMGWRHIPPTAGVGDGLDSYFTFPSENHIRQVFIGEGELVWNSLRWDENPTQFHIVNALSELPVLEMRPALITRGSTNLIVPDRPTRPLR